MTADDRTLFPGADRTLRMPRPGGAGADATVRLPPPRPLPADGEPTQVDAGAATLSTLPTASTQPAADAAAPRRERRAEPSPVAAQLQRLVAGVNPLLGAA